MTKERSPTQNISGGTSFLSSTKKIEFSVVNNGNAKVYLVKGVSFNILSFNLKSLILQKI